MKKKAHIEGGTPLLASGVHLCMYRTAPSTTKANKRKENFPSAIVLVILRVALYTLCRFPRRVTSTGIV